MLNPASIDVWRDGDGTYQLRWQTQCPQTRVTVEPVADAQDHQVHYPSTVQAFVTGLLPGGRHLFRFRDDQGSDITAGERRICLEGTPNLRDLGGYPTADGRRVKWGSLFRSSQLANLTPLDLDRLADLRLDLVFDLRQESEQQAVPAMLPALNTPRLISLPIVPGNHLSLLTRRWEGPSDPEAMGQLMIEINTEFAESHSATFSALFATLIDTAEAHILVNCAAGKDRTGFAVALLLFALGVPEQSIFHDYLLSARYFKPEAELDRIRAKYHMQDLPTAAVLPLLQVQPEYLQAALQSVKRRHQSVLHYLSRELGVGEPERAELRRRYLL